MSESKRREKASTIRERDRGLHMGAFYAFSLYLCRVAAMTFFELRVERTWNQPRSGPAVFAGNHQSFLDPWIVGCTLLRRLSFLARETLFRVPVLGWMIRRYDALPIPRDGGTPRKTIEVCQEAVSKGRAVVLFPEGTRSPDGRMQPLKRGVALLARRADAPVVPVLVRGAFDAWPRKQLLPRPGRVTVTFGVPIRYEADETADSFMARLAASYRDLAVECGVPELAAGPLPGGDGPFLDSETEPSRLLETATSGSHPAPHNPM